MVSANIEYRVTFFATTAAAERRLARRMQDMQAAADRLAAAWGASIDVHIERCRLTELADWCGDDGWQVMLTRDIAAGCAKLTHSPGVETVEAVRLYHFAPILRASGVRRAAVMTA